MHDYFNPVAHIGGMGLAFWNILVSDPLRWLNLIARKRSSVDDIVHEHWQKYGRDIYCRHDYEAVDANLAKARTERTVIT